MRAFFVPVTLTCVLFFETPCSAQTVTPQSEASNTQSAAIHEFKTGDNCTFQAAIEIESYPNCIFKDSQGNLFVAQNYVKKMRFDSHGLAAVYDDDQSRHEFMYVDRKGRVIIQGVLNSDNCDLTDLLYQVEC